MHSGARLVPTRTSLAFLVALALAAATLGTSTASASTIPYFGSMGAKTLAAPIVSIAATGDGNGYWELGSDGGIFSFGDAHFYGSTGHLRLKAPIVRMAVTA